MATVIFLTTVNGERIKQTTTFNVAAALKDYENKYRQYLNEERWLVDNGAIVK